jgi:hypothetical protein
MAGGALMQMHHENSGLKIGTLLAMNGVQVAVRANHFQRPGCSPGLSDITKAPSGRRLFPLGATQRAITAC